MYDITSQQFENGDKAGEDRIYVFSIKILRRKQLILVEKNMHWKNTGIAIQLSPLFSPSLFAWHHKRIT